MRFRAILIILLCVAFVLSAGCTQTSFGTRAPVGFGAAAEDQQIIDCLKTKYGEPCSSGPPRFVEPIITTLLNERNLPADSVVQLNRNARNLYFWVFFDRFAPKDPVSLSMKYLPTNKIVDRVEKTPDGNCGAIHAEYLMPDGGWPLGQYEITISGRGTSATKTFEVISGPTVTGPLSYSPGMCSDVSGGTVTMTSAPATFRTTPVIVTQTGNAGMTGLVAAPAGWNGCWQINTSPCGATELQLKESSGRVAGFWCENTKALAVSRQGSVLNGEWWTVSEDAESCCDNGLYGPYHNYCDPTCMAGRTGSWADAFPDLFAGSLEFQYGNDGRSLSGTWGYGDQDLETGGTPISGSPTPCTTELIIGSAPQSGVSPMITQTVVVVQPDR